MRYSAEGQNEDAAGLRKEKVPAALTSSDVWRASNEAEDSASESAPQASPIAPLEDRARPLLDDGFRLVLLGRGKRPIEEAWQDNPVTSIEELQRRWGASKYRSNNVGILTGLAGGGILVIDVDVHKDRKGMQSLERLKLLYDLPQTRTHKTASGGLHLLFKVTQDYVGTPGALGEGLDIRCDRNQIVAPGSVIDGTAYTVVDDSPIVDLPADIAALLKPAGAKPTDRQEIADNPDSPYSVMRATNYLREHAPVPVEGGTGNTIGYSVAAELKKLGVTRDTAVMLMAEYWNTRHDFPREHRELEQVVENGFKYGRGGAGEADPTQQFDALPIDGPIELPELKTSESFERIFFDDAFVLDDEPDAIIDGLIPAGAIGFVYGPSYHGKSLVTALMAHCIATGAPFGDRDVTPGGVMILALEGHGGIKKRVEALRRTKGHPKAPIMFGKGSLDFGTGERAAKQILTECFAFRQRYGALPRLIIIDTFSAAALSLETDKDVDINKILHVMRRIQLALNNEATIASIHHPGKTSERGMRGSYALLANSDFTVKVENGTISVDKNRDDEKRDDMHFEVDKVFLGLKKNGKPINSAVARLTDVSRSRLIVAENKLSKAQRHVLKILRRLYTAPASGSDVFGVPFDKLLEAAVAEEVTKGKKHKGRQSSVSAMLKVLKDSGLAETSIDEEWRPVPTGGKDAQ